MLFINGKVLSVAVDGSSHGEFVGVTVNGFPKGETVNLEKLQAFLNRRRPKGDTLSTVRSESDIPEFLSGMKYHRLTGEPLRAVIRNNDVRDADYDAFHFVPRPSHADYTAYMKYGETVDRQGGGAFSGRMTAPLCVAGGIALQILERRGIFIGSHLLSVGPIKDRVFPLEPDEALFSAIRKKELPVISDCKGEEMKHLIESVKAEKDSVGACVECAVIGIPVSLGGMMIDSIESRLSSSLFAIPAIKGVSFGDGFLLAEKRGSDANDYICLHFDKANTKLNIRTETNHGGGILGGISNGMPIVFSVVFKPTPSIGIPQKSVDLRTMKKTVLTVSGRHDPCIGVRGIVAVEAVAACVMLDLLLE